jgi:hypothetical protein
MKYSQKTLSWGYLPTLVAQSNKQGRINFEGSLEEAKEKLIR